MLDDIQQSTIKALPQDISRTPYHLSDVRTGLPLTRKRKRSPSQEFVSQCLPSSPDFEFNDSDSAACDLQAIFNDIVCSDASCPDSEVCVDCVVDCQDEDCQADPEGQCTEPCMAQACADQADCLQTCSNAVCESVGKPCAESDACLRLMDEAFKQECCAAYYNCLDPSCLDTTKQTPWEIPLLQSRSSEGSFSSTSDPDPFSAPRWAHQTLCASHHNQDSPPASGVGAARNPLFDPVQGQNDLAAFTCKWHNCKASFTNLDGLVGHVNVTHLLPSKLSITGDLQQIPNPPALLQSNEQVSDFDWLCHWNDCQEFDFSSIAGPSSQPALPLDVLTNHLFHDHLGLAIPTNETTGLNSSTEIQLPVLPCGSKASNQLELPSKATNASPPCNKGALATPAPSPPPFPTSPGNGPAHDCTTTSHLCKWSGCSGSFSSCAALTEHLATEHVGSGKRTYDCHWDNCARSGDHGFASKQKILRHLQAHTGYRPYTCDQCGQHFSEAATLQQHIRRHTQEKPYVCDFPGCGKAFAITGALTIHKRTHNGERPYRCPHCERAFAESSNLSKHIRTHTGTKPYQCHEPGCGKAFARPDQLSRHAQVHARKKA